MIQCLASARRSALATFHILGIPHTISTPEYTAYPFTQKVVRLCAMLDRLGYPVIHYGHIDSKIEGENVAIMDDDILDRAYPGWHWQTQGPPPYRRDDLAFRTYRERAVAAIRARKRPGDFLLCPFGGEHAGVAIHHSDMIVVETGIGYFTGIFAPHKAFESYACMHAYQGLKGIGCMDRDLDQHVVIPNSYDLGEFEYRAKRDDYLLFMGRLIREKGIDIAVDVAERTGKRLVIAGPKDPAGPSTGGYRLPRRAEYVGVAGLDQRRELLAGAAAVLCPSRYIEPFCGVHVEAMLSGTPAITSDWGAFAEYNLHGHTGYRCRNVGDFIRAVDRLDEIDPARCREWAESRFSMATVGGQYERFFAGIDR